MNKVILKGFVLAIMAAIFWGISGTFGQFLFQERGVNVEWLITVRMLVSGIILLIYARFYEKAAVFKIWYSKKDVIQLLVFSIAGMLSVQYTYFAAIKHSNAGNSNHTAVLRSYHDRCFPSFKIQENARNKRNTSHIACRNWNFASRNTR
ncbi:DMT family transporter [Flavobacterium gelatinilyticum]|uniref:DMT family transporter n=1 Tax=Flavobacterium gelatinilyticum TaxID=3003260 RepID=UPI002480E32E|nr:DMT family transporter [Flavobacterium gelatinilyticum]